MPTLSIRNRSQQGIRFLNLTFAGPALFSTTRVPAYGGLYAILLYDATWRPLPYRLIYVGETGNAAERVCRSHEKHESWTRAASGYPLYVAFCAMSSALARRMAERRIIERYKPECNMTFNQNALALRALGLLYSDVSSWPFNL